MPSILSTSGHGKRQASCRAAPRRPLSCGRTRANGARAPKPCATVERPGLRSSWTQLQTTGPECRKWVNDPTCAKPCTSEDTGECAGAPPDRRAVRHHERLLLDQIHPKRRAGYTVGREVVVNRRRIGWRGLLQIRATQLQADEIGAGGRCRERDGYRAVAPVRRCLREGGACDAAASRVPDVARGLLEQNAEVTGADRLRNHEGL